MLLKMIGLVFLAGCIGGFINGRKADKWGLRYKNQDCNTWFPGVIGYVLMGGVAAVVFWGLYGPLKDKPVSQVADTVMNITFGELAGSVLLGLGGHSWLSAQSGKKCAERRLDNH